METAKDTVNSIISSATTMIYGDTTENKTASTGQTHDSMLGDSTTSGTTATSHNTTGGTEPLSGVTGDGTANKPYDGGNTTGEPTNTTSSTGSTGSTAGTAAAGAASGPSVSSNPGAATTGTAAPDSGVGKSSATATTAQDVGSAPPESGAAPVAKQQGADKPNDAPDAEQSKAISDKKEHAENAMADEKAADSGSSGPTTAVGGSTGGSSKPSDAGPKPLGSGGNSGSAGKDDELGSKSTESGTGEKYIKSSGTKADGGDFDASNAGAGREADRLLEEKGIHREEGNTGPPADVPGNKPTASEEKVSFGQKLKDKLHIKNKDKP